MTPLVYALINAHVFSPVVMSAAGLLLTQLLKLWRGERGSSSPYYAQQLDRGSPGRCHPGQCRSDPWVISFFQTFGDARDEEAAPGQKPLVVTYPRILQTDPWTTKLQGWDRRVKELSDPFMEAFTFPGDICTDDLPAAGLFFPPSLLLSPLVLVTSASSGTQHDTAASRKDFHPNTTSNT